jgi:RNA polymerase sigma factor (sigma-70 family)
MYLVIAPITSETDLVEMLKQNQREGYEYLYDNYSSALYGTIKKIVKNEDTAQDVLQDVFVKIWRNISQYDKAKGKLFTWMLNISRNEAIDRMRSKAATNDQKNCSLEFNRSKLNSIKMVDVIRHEFMGIKDFIDKLAHNEKFLINLMYFEGYTQMEIAAEYNIPLGTVKSRLRTATANLKKILAE